MKTGNRVHAGGVVRPVALALAHIALALANAVAPTVQAQEQAQQPRPPTQELTEQQRLRAQSPGGPLTTGVELPRWPEQRELVGSTPVTDEMLANPSPNDWLTWRRTHDGLGFSPLSQYRQKQRRHDLQLAWSLALPAGPNTATPLVHDGVIYVHSFGDHVQALDAATGDELWHYARELPSTLRPTVKRNMALYGDKTLLRHVGRARRGARRARRAPSSGTCRSRTEGSGFGLSGGPLVARGKVMQGVNGQAPGRRLYRGARCRDRRGGVAFLHDRTARRARRRQLERPAARASARAARSGRPAATTPSAISRSSARRPPTTRDRCATRSPQRGVTNEALYTNSTIALDPDTGKLAWHFQHVPNDQWDFDWAFERQIVKLPVDGRERRVVLTAGKEAIYDALDLDDGGRYLFSIDLGLQNFITAIDPRTGAKTIDPKLVPSREETDRRVPARGRREELGAGVDQSRDAGCCSCRSSNRAWI